MRSSDPHVSIVVHQSDESAKFFLVLGFGNVSDSVNFAGNWLDSVTGDPVSKIF